MRDAVEDGDCVDVSETKCDGNLAVTCSSGLRITEDCADYGRECQNTSGNAHCVTEATECVGRYAASATAVESTPDTCEGTRIKTCMDNRFEYIECATIGETGQCAGGVTLQGDTRGTLSIDFYFHIIFQLHSRLHVSVSTDIHPKTAFACSTLYLPFFLGVASMMTLDQVPMIRCSTFPFAVERKGASSFHQVNIVPNHSCAQAKIRFSSR
jgi:hypothetical protein